MSGRSKSWVARSVAEALCILGASILGSLYARDILDRAFRFGGAVPPTPIILFWLCLVGAIALVLWNSIERGHERHEHKVALDEQKSLTHDLRTLVRTQPPLTFLERVRDAWRKSHVAHAVACENPSITSESIRTILAQLCDLADTYNDHQTGDYAASVLVYVPTEEVVGHEGLIQALETVLRFMPRDVALSGLDGCLWLVSEWTASLHQARESADIPAPNTQVSAIALPVPKTKSTRLSDGREEWYVLPGGPRCFVEDDPAIIPDTMTVGAWMRENASFDEKVVEDLEAYMQHRAEQGRFRAFLSLPLRMPGERPGSSTPIGVLNLESTQAGFFSARSLGSEADELADQRVREFSSIIEPIVAFVASLRIKAVILSK